MSELIQSHFDDISLPVKILADVAKPDNTDGQVISENRRGLYTAPEAYGLLNHYIGDWIAGKSINQIEIDLSSSVPESLGQSAMLLKNIYKELENGKRLTDPVDSFNRLSSLFYAAKDMEHALKNHPGAKQKVQASRGGKHISVGPGLNEADQHNKLRKQVLVRQQELRQIARDLWEDHQRLEAELDKDTRLFDSKSFNAVSVVVLMAVVLGRVSPGLHEGYSYGEDGDDTLMGNPDMTFATNHVWDNPYIAAAFGLPLTKARLGEVSQQVPEPQPTVVAMQPVELAGSNQAVPEFVDYESVTGVFGEEVSELIPEINVGSERVLTPQEFDDFLQRTNDPNVRALGELYDGARQAFEVVSVTYKDDEYQLRSYLVLRTKTPFEDENGNSLMVGSVISIDNHEQIFHARLTEEDELSTHVALRVMNPELREYFQGQELYLNGQRIDFNQIEDGELIQILVNDANEPTVLVLKGLGLRLTQYVINTIGSNIRTIPSMSGSALPEKTNATPIASEATYDPRVVEDTGVDMRKVRIDDFGRVIYDENGPGQDDPTQRWYKVPGGWVRSDAAGSLTVKPIYPALPGGRELNLAEIPPYISQSLAFNGEIEFAEAAPEGAVVRMSRDGQVLAYDPNLSQWEPRYVYNQETGVWEDGFKYNDRWARAEMEYDQIVYSPDGQPLIILASAADLDDVEEMELRNRFIVGGQGEVRWNPTPEMTQSFHNYIWSHVFEQLIKDDVRNQNGELYRDLLDLSINPSLEEISQALETLRGNWPDVPFLTEDTIRTAERTWANPNQPLIIQQIPSIQHKVMQIVVEIQFFLLTVK